jgi:hypothetical protein
MKLTWPRAETPTHWIVMGLTAAASSWQRPPWRPLGLQHSRRSLQPPFHVKQSLWTLIAAATN